MAKICMYANKPVDRRSPRLIIFLPRKASQRERQVNDRLINPSHACSHPKAGGVFAHVSGNASLGSSSG